MPLLTTVLQHFLDFPAATGHKFSKRGPIIPKGGYAKITLLGMMHKKKAKITRKRPYHAQV